MTLGDLVTIVDRETQLMESSKSLLVVDIKTIMTLVFCLDISIIKKVVEAQTKYYQVLKADNIAIWGSE